MTLAGVEQLLKDSIGLDVASIGASAVERAVRERQMACKLSQEVAYWEHVRASEVERQLLIEAVVVPETWFFRDREAFAALADVVYQEWLRANRDGMFRLLSVPCSTGEEPYSMAMALRDAGAPPDRVRIDAVDVSERVLRHALRGVYGRNSFRGADQRFRDRYFEPVGEGYQLADDVLGQVHFKPGNVCSPAFLGDSDPYAAIFCRNLLIYFDRVTQDRAIGVLTRLLAPDGFLFVGSSETGVMINHDFVSAKLPMAFAFRRTSPAHAEPARLQVGRRRPRRTFTSMPPAPRPRTAVRVGPGLKKAAADPPAGPAPDAIAEARRLADQGQFAEAAALCEGALRRGPSAEAYYLLALVRDASGNRSDADAYYRKALYLEPTHREALAHLALLMEGQGRQAEAQVFRNRMRRLEPMDEKK